MRYARCGLTVLVLSLAACSDRGGARVVPPAATTPSPAAGATTTGATSVAAGPTATVTTVDTSGAATTASSTSPTTGAAGEAAIDQPQTWPALATVTGPDALQVIAARDGDLVVCVGLRTAAGDAVDACESPARSWAAVIAGRERLFVVGFRTSPDPFVVSTLTSDNGRGEPVTVTPAPYGSGFAVGLALRPGDDVASIDGGIDTSTCRYRSLLVAVQESGATASGQPPMAITRCDGAGALASVYGTSAALQGAAALFARGPSAWELLDLGGDVCGHAPSGPDIPPSVLANAARAVALCASLGLP